MDVFSAWTGNCCTLQDPTWRFTTPGPMPVMMKTTRDYATSSSRNAIINVDTKEVGPEDIPHHPLDSMRGIKFEARNPGGIAVNSRTEQIYVMDSAFCAILVFGPDGSFQRTFGSFGHTGGLFSQPKGIAYDVAHDRILVADKGNSRIQALDATTGRFLFAFGCPGRDEGQFNHPWGVAVSPTGHHIAVTDSRNHRIQVFTADGKYCSSHYLNRNRSTLGRPYPQGIAWDKRGTALYISDYNLNRIVTLNPESGQIRAFATGLSRPSGLAVDNAGNLLVCEVQNDNFKIFRDDGALLGTITRIGKEPVHSPADVAVFPAGYVALLDSKGRIRVF